MAQYKWREGFPRPPIDADVFGSEVERIAREKGRNTDPADIVEAAKDKASPIHSVLQWNDQKAATAFRIDQARRLLGALQIVRVQTEHGPAISNRAFFVARPDPNGRREYVPHNQIISDRDLRKQVISSARKELQCFIGKYRGILAMGRFIPRLEEVMNAMLDEVEQLELDANSRRAKGTQIGTKAPAPQVAAE